MSIKFQDTCLTHILHLFLDDNFWRVGVACKLLKALVLGSWLCIAWSLLRMVQDISDRYAVMMNCGDDRYRKVKDANYTTMTGKTGGAWENTHISSQSPFPIPDSLKECCLMTNQVQEFFAGFLVFLEYANHCTGDSPRAGFLHTPHHHAHMGGFHDYCYTLRF